MRFVREYHFFFFACRDFLRFFSFRNSATWDNGKVICFSQHEAFCVFGRLKKFLWPLPGYILVDFIWERQGDSLMLMSLVSHFWDKCSSESLKIKLFLWREPPVKPQTLASISKVFHEHKAMCSLPGMLASKFWVVIYMNK